VSRRPNILWFVATQWRGQALGVAGDPNVRTPVMDALAAAGTWFRQAVTPHPFGPHARAALLTGVPSPENGVGDYWDPLPMAARTVAHALAERGFTTAWFGKWHLWRRDPKAPLVGEEHARIVVPPEARGGFGHWEGFESGFLLNDPWLHGTELPEPKVFGGYQPDVLVERARRWLGGREGPWFAVVSVEPPHPPYEAPAAGFVGPEPARLTLAGNVPRGGEAEARARRELAGYYAHIAATDRALGRLVDGLPRETIIVATSVHGDMHGAHGLFRKGWPHEESVRVPLVVRGAPRGVAAGRVEDAPVSLLDLPAMAVAWAEGHRWRCEREAAEISMPCVVRLPHQCDRVWRGRRSRQRKQVWLADGSPWLEFDLMRDPLERHNGVPLT
jgi:arylsulfatase A-like enzyme